MTLDEFLSELEAFSDRQNHPIKKSLKENPGAAAWKTHLHRWLLACKLSPHNAALPTELSKTVKALISLSTVSYSYKLIGNEMRMKDERGGRAVTAALADLLDVIADFDAEFASELVDIGHGLHVDIRHDILRACGVQ